MRAREARFDAEEIAKNLDEYVHQSGMISDGAILEDTEVLMASTPLVDPSMNIAVVRKADHLEELVPMIAKFFGAKGKPYTVWWLRIGDDGIADRIARTGLRPYFEAPGMALDAGEAEINAPDAEGVRVISVSGREGMLRFAEAASKGYEVPVEMILEFRSLASQLDPGRRRKNVVFVAERGSVPVATALTFLGSSSAGVYWVATSPNERKKGIGRMITREAIRAAVSAGYRRIILQSSPMAAPLYASMGFERRCVYEVYGP